MFKILVNSISENREGIKTALMLSVLKANTLHDNFTAMELGDFCEFPWWWCQRNITNEFPRLLKSNLVQFNVVLHYQCKAPRRILSYLLHCKQEMVFSVLCILQINKHSYFYVFFFTSAARVNICSVSCGDSSCYNCNMSLKQQTT